MRRFVIIAVCVALALATTGCGARSRSRSELARSAAVGVVAAIARGDATEIDARFAPGVPASERALPSLPASFGTDPKMYSATFVGDPERKDSVEAVVVTDKVLPSELTRVRVGMVWVADKGRNGDWQVTTVLPVAQ